MSLNINPQKGNQMTEEEALFTEVDNILKDANEQELDRYRKYVKSVALNVEQTIYNEFGSEEAYQLWTLSMEHKGTPESIAEFKVRALEEQPNAVNLTVQDDDDEINACLGMEIAYVAQPGMPPDINGLLSNRQAMMLIHAKRKNLVGFVARTGAWASQDKDSKPSEADDRQSVTITMYYTSGLMVVVPRNDDTKEVLEESIQIHDVFSPCADAPSKYDGHSNAEVAEMCSRYLGETHGKSLSLLYQAYAYPKSLMYDDLEMYQAVTADALLAAANEETEQE